MFSIIIPLYNKAPYVEKAIRSVVTQTYQNFELIIIDDGSKDESYAIAKQVLCTLTPPLGGWEVVTQSNQGVSITRNNGVKLAKYDYIAFLDADDWWAPTFLEEMKALLEEFPDAGIYGSSYYKVKNGKFIPADIGIEVSFKKGYINYFRTYSSTLWMPLTSISVIIPKMIFNEMNGFNSYLKLGEDFHLWVRIASNYKVVFLNKRLSYYNQDVDVVNRAVKYKTYSPTEHMLFVNYGNLMKNIEFRFLFEKLALYALKPYFVYEINKNEVRKLLDNIKWRNHNFGNILYYRILPKKILLFWIKLRIFASNLKKCFVKNH